MLGYWVEPLHPAATGAAGAPSRHLGPRPSMKIFALAGRPALFFILLAGLVLPACAGKESRSAPQQSQSNRPTEWNGQFRIIWQWYWKRMSKSAAT